MNQRLDAMPTRVLNRICARPMLICWAVGALVVNGIIFAAPSAGGRLITVATDLQGWALLILAVIAATGLGFFLGMFTCWPWVRRFCSRFNGAPYRPGDRVVILAGPLRGMASQVEDVTTGQGGQDVVWLDLGPERGKGFGNIFEEYSVMKIEAGRPEVSHNSQPTLAVPASVEPRPPVSPPA